MNRAETGLILLFIQMENSPFTDRFAKPFNLTLETLLCFSWIVKLLYSRTLSLSFSCTQFTCI